MDKKELIEFLKDRLQIKIEIKRTIPSYGEGGGSTLKVSLLLASADFNGFGEAEVISESTEYLDHAESSRG